MRFVASLLLLGLGQERVCDHGDHGEGRAIDLDAVVRAHRDAARALAAFPERVTYDDGLDAAWESGLPACHGRARRRVEVDELPDGLVGRTITFAERPREGTLHAITATRRLRDVVGGVLVTPELAERFGVRCAPSLVRIAGAKEVEIDEGD